jgi:hypothetical protein
MRRLEGDVSILSRALSRIVKLVREHGLAGAAVLRGIECFGAHSRIHTSTILRLSEDLRRDRDLDRVVKSECLFASETAGFVTACCLFRHKFSPQLSPEPARFSLI